MRCGVVLLGSLLSLLPSVSARSFAVAVSITACTGLMIDILHGGGSWARMPGLAPRVPADRFRFALSPGGPAFAWIKNTKRATRSYLKKKGVVRVSEFLNQLVWNLPRLL